tara:strand:- start:167 stop:586 length:420 start_codon:yes stop_codon:yes gene_type:complete
LPLLLFSEVRHTELLKVDLNDVFETRRGEVFVHTAPKPQATVVQSEIPKFYVEAAEGARTEKRPAVALAVRSNFALMKGRLVADHSRFVGPVQQRAERLTLCSVCNELRRTPLEPRRGGCGGTSQRGVSGNGEEAICDR